MDFPDFFSKGNRLYKNKHVEVQEVSKIKRCINERTRETLNDKTPIEAIKELRSNIIVEFSS